MKLAIILPSLAVGGTEKIRLTLARCLKHRGYDVHFILLLSHGELFTDADKEFSIYCLNAKTFRSSLFALYTHLRANRYDVILVGLWPLTFFVPIIIRLSSRNRRSGIIVSEHASLLREYGKSLRSKLILKCTTFVGYRIADFVTSVSGSLRDELSQLANISRERVFVLPNPLPDRPPFGGDARERFKGLWPGNPRLRIVNVGALKSQKNQKLLLDAMRRLKFRDVSLLIVGDGPERLRLEKMLCDENLNDCVRLLGWVNNSSEIIAAADLFVLSSNFEGYPNVLLEALVVGTPIISTDCDYGPREILADGKYGVLVPTNNLDCLCTSILNQKWKSYSRVDTNTMPHLLPKASYIDKFESLLAKSIDKVNL